MPSAAVNASRSVSVQPRVRHSSSGRCLTPAMHHNQYDWMGCIILSSSVLSMMSRSQSPSGTDQVCSDIVSAKQSAMTAMKAGGQQTCKYDSVTHTLHTSTEPLVPGLGVPLSVNQCIASDIAPRSEWGDDTGMHDLDNTHPEREPWDIRIVPPPPFPYPPFHMEDRY